MTRVAVLTGGIGGAKLVHGLALLLPGDRLTAIVNTGDDFRHLGLEVSPDLDSLLYALAERGDQDRGWGSADETWNFMAALVDQGGPDWFRLGDRDLALHILRTAELAQGKTLAMATARLARGWDVDTTILPMTNDRVATMLETDVGTLEFQQYFVERHCAPVVRAVRFDGAETASPAPGVLTAIANADTIVIAPSNPYLSIDPILAIPAIRDALAAARAPRICVCPIVAGKAVKGPTAKLMRELGIPVTPAAIADHYAGLIDALLLDRQDGADGLSIRHMIDDTIMLDIAGRIRVAKATLDLAANFPQ